MLLTLAPVSWLPYEPIYLYFYYISFTFSFSVYHYVSFFFFFSSRRRHTRCLSDWSSDVCSSDLECNPAERSQPRKRILSTWWTTGSPARRRERARRHGLRERDDAVRDGHRRSEERRVGKGVDLGGRRIIEKQKREQVIADVHARK